MRQYHDLLTHILENGEVREDRTGTGTRSIFGYQMRFNLADGFPLLTTKDLSEDRWNNIVEELLWFLSGDTHVKTLMDKGVNIWNRDAYRNDLPDLPEGMTYKAYVEAMKSNAELGAGETMSLQYGDLGRIYGQQWRSWQKPDGGTVDQIKQVIEAIRKDPYSRRHVVSAWNPGELDEMGLPPCHVLFQFYVSNGKLSCQLYQRSGDVFLGVPYNIASYALLTMMIADQTGHGYGDFVHTLGDAHLYSNHIEQAKEQLRREPKPLPSVFIEDADSIDDYSASDFHLYNYDPYPEIKAPLSVGLKDENTKNSPSGGGSR